MRYSEKRVRGDVSSEHIVQLFDGAESLADAVSKFAADGLGTGPVILVMTPEHLELALARLASLGVAVEASIASGDLIVCDADETLGWLLRNGWPDPDLFDATVGALVRRLAATGRPLHVYGEMVNVLAARGDYRAARELENIWNDLRETTSFTLLCGYSAVHFGDPRTADALRLICRAHSHVRSDPDDALATFLVGLTGSPRRAPASA